jgi:putative ABC transport system permease protein
MSLASTLRTLVTAVDPGLPLYRVHTMADLLDASVAQRRFRTLVLAAFAAIALLLASIGIYAVMQYLVAQRTREFGIRAALGATSSDLLASVLKRSGRLIGIGVGLGLVGALTLTSVVRSLLYGIAPYDALTLAGVAVLLGSVALLASYLPARQAASCDPLSAMRAE